MRGGRGEGAGGVIKSDSLLTGAVATIIHLKINLLHFSGGGGLMRQKRLIFYYWGERSNFSQQEAGSRPMLRSGFRQDPSGTETVTAAIAPQSHPVLLSGGVGGGGNVVGRHLNATSDRKSGRKRQMFRTKGTSICGSIVPRFIHAYLCGRITAEGSDFSHVTTGPEGNRIFSQRLISDGRFLDLI